MPLRLPLAGPLLSGLALALLLSAAPAGAANPTTWSFDTLLRTTLDTHPALQARQRGEAAAQAELAAAQWQRWPTPGVQMQSDGQGGTETLLFLQQPLWTGGRIAAGIDAASARTLVAQQDVALLRHELLGRLIDAWVDAQRRHAQQQVLRHSVQQHERLLQLIERRVAGDVSPRVDGDLARSRMFQAANELSATTQALSDALAGQPVLALAPTSSEAMARTLAQLPPDLPSAIARATQAAPQLAKLAFEAQAAQADVASAQAALWPQLNLRIEHRDNRGSANNTRPASDQRALLTLESQFGAGLAQGAQVQAAIARHDALADQRLAATRELHASVTEAWNQKTAAQLRQQHSRIFQESASAVFESYARQYVVGQKSWLDVMNAVREASTAGLATHDAQADATRAALRLQLLTGGL